MKISWFIRLAAGDIYSIHNDVQIENLHENCWSDLCSSYDYLYCACKIYISQLLQWDGKIHECMFESVLTEQKHTPHARMPAHA